MINIGVDFSNVSYEDIERLKTKIEVSIRNYEEAIWEFIEKTQPYKHEALNFIFTLFYHSFDSLTDDIEEFYNENNHLDESL